MSLKERSSEAKSSLPIIALVIGMILVAVAAMGFLLGGPMVLRTEGKFESDFIVLFMLLTFVITAFTEIFLYRQLSRLTEKPRLQAATSAVLATPIDYYASQPRALAEPLPSVTENTTRTLQYQRSEPGRKDYS
jgi:hypothetical protein